MQKTWVRSLGQEDPRRRKRPTAGILPGEPMHREAWRATAHGVAKSRARLSNFHFHPLGVCNLNQNYPCPPVRLHRRAVSTAQKQANSPRTQSIWDHFCPTNKVPGYSRLFFFPLSETKLLRAFFRYVSPSCRKVGEGLAETDTESSSRLFVLFLVS